MAADPILPALGRFEIRRPIGRGGFGDVYLAFDPEAGHEIALKVLPLRDDDAQEIWQAEENGARIQQRIHAVANQVAEVFEFGKIDTYYFIAMEYVDGTDLSRLLKDNRQLDEAEAVDIACQLCDILEHAHGYRLEVDGNQIDGVVHGDLKPSNIRLQDGGTVRLLDFGIAKYLSRSRRFTQGHSLSIPYASPERLEHGTMDRRSDLWSIGVLLYEMVSGRRPFQGRNDYSLERAIVSGRWRPLPAGCCSDDLERIIGKSLAADPDSRFASAADLHAALRASQDGTGFTEETRRTSPSSDATRRTVAMHEDEPTRRTTPGGASAVRDRPRTDPIPSSKTPRLRPKRRLAFPLLAVLALSQVVILARAVQLRQAVAESTEGQLDRIWDNYQTLDRFDVLGLPLLPVRGPLRIALIDSASLVISGYEVDRPRPDLPWATALRQLRSARALGADTHAVLAQIYYCQGHIDRIAANDLDRRNSHEAARAQRADAIVHFREAARLDPEWAAPYLGLAKIYASEDFHLVKMLDAIDTAEKLGHTPGSREIEQKARGYYRQCRDRLNQADNAPRDNRRSILKEAKERCRASIRNYNKILDLSDIALDRLKAQTDLLRAEAKLDELATR